MFENFAYMMKRGYTANGTQMHACAAVQQENGTVEPAVCTRHVQRRCARHVSRVNLFGVGNRYESAWERSGKIWRFWLARRLE